jgi:hypothetical protein
VIAGLAGAGIFLVHFDVIADFPGGHGRYSFAPAPAFSAYRLARESLFADAVVEGCMVVILWAFTLFHIFLGTACLVLAVRMLTPEERAMWRSPLPLLVAELLCWIYPIAAYVATRSAWAAHDAGKAFALPILLAPIAWLLVMGLFYAIADFADDGIIGNARRSDG